MKLLLFDIDGTILHAHGVGRQLVDVIFDELTGRKSPDRLVYSGKTDPQICREMADAVGLIGDERDAVAEEALTIYTERILEALPGKKISLIPGADSLIERLAEHSDVQLALLTGNVESVAYAKLDAVGLRSHFDFGAFGSDSADRYELPAIAKTRAVTQTGQMYDGGNVVIIGDTEHDIRCGLSIGAFSVAVCTGHYSSEELSRHNPNALFESLEDADEFHRIVIDRAA